MPHHFKLIELNGQQVAQGWYPAIQCNTAVTRDFRRLIPKPIVVVVHINRCPARALIDTGSLADFMSSTLADQLKIKWITLEKPLTIQLAVQGSGSKVNFGAKAVMSYQHIKEDRFFDIINLQDYDLILGTPFLFQHQVLVGLNPPHIIIGSDKALPVWGEQVSILESRTAGAVEEDLEQVCRQLLEWAKPLCAKASQTSLPPLRAINCTIPLIDPEWVYKWHPSRCPEPLRPQWGEKRQAYLSSGCWKMTSMGNTVPMLFIQKPSMDKLRTVVDLCECNSNTQKLSSPLPDIDGICHIPYICASHPKFQMSDPIRSDPQIRTRSVTISFFIHILFI
jgi:hypothetical protein